MTGPEPGANPGRSPADVPSADAFARLLARSRLIDPPRLEALRAALPPAARASAQSFADHLIEIGELTHYQADKLLRGRWQGLVVGPYHVLAPLGRGGMGTVYLARDARAPGEGVKGRAGEGVKGGRGEGENTNPLPLPPPPGGPLSPRHPVTPSPLHSPLLALKILPPRRAREEERVLLRFRREMDLGRHLDHPNVTRTFDAGEVGGVHYIAMEYVPGRSLRQWVAADGPLPADVAARLFTDVAAGLEHAHGRGLIHRDLKPSNVMVTPDGRAKILDLGMALLVGEELPADPTVVGGRGYILGTMDYIAPEQAADATDVGPRSDLYALGCSLYFAVTGIAPFPGGTSQQKIRWHRTTEPPAANAINPAVPADFSRLIEHLMAKQPGHRPESAAMVRTLLRPWAGTVPADQPAPHPVPVTVGEIDQRAHDPGLWDELPVADVVEPLPAAAPETAPPSRPLSVALSAVIVMGVVLGFLVLVALVGLVRRL